MLSPRFLTRPLLGVVLGFAGCGDIGSDTGEVVQSIEARYSEAAVSNELLALADVTTFNWDTFHVFGSYTTASDMNEGLGFRWDDSRDLSTDRYDLLVWVADDSVVESALVERSDVSFPWLPDGISERDAVFASLTADTSSSGTVVLTLPD